MPAGIYVWAADGTPQFDGTTRTTRILGVYSVRVIVPTSSGTSDHSYTPPEGADFCYFRGVYPNGAASRGVFTWMEGGTIKVRGFEKPPYNQPTDYGVVQIVYGKY